MADDIYSDLLQALLTHPERELTIEANVTASAMRKGLTKAIKFYNRNAAAMSLVGLEVPELRDTACVMRASDELASYLVLKLLPPEESPPNRFKTKMQFKILADSEDS